MVKSRSKELVLLEQAAVHIMDTVKALRLLELVPMDYVMSKVPGETVAEKVEKVGVSRQTYYYWLQGRSRPSLRQAQRLTKLTSIPTTSIRT